MIFNNSKFNNHWPTKALNELGTFNRGKSKHRPRNDKRLFDNGSIPLIQTGEVRQSNLFIDSHSANYNDFGLAQSKLWPKNTLCITIAANIAETAMLGYDMCFPDSIVGFNAFPDECSEVFMHYIFTYIRSSIQNRIQGSIQDNINIEYLTNLKFKIPGRDERKQIENLLYSLDTKIEVNNKINQEMEAMAKTIYDYWFVQFDFPDTNGKPYKSSGGKMVYNEKLKRDIPEGWEVKPLTDEMDLQYGFPFSTKLFNEERNGVPIIRIRDIQKCTISNYSTEEVDIKYKLEKGDILIGMDGNFHINYWNKEDCFLNQRSLRIRTTNDSISEIQARYMIEPYIKAREKNVSRTTVGHLSARDINDLKILKATQEIQSNANSFFKSTLNKIVSNREQNQKLAELRDWLLPMLMNGQVRVAHSEDKRNLGEVEEKLGMVAEEGEVYKME